MSKKDDIKRLWKECFGDSPEYTDMYFSRVYSDDKALASYSDENRVVSSLQLSDYSMLFADTLVPLCYIGGATTARKHRGRGHNSRLMIRALDIALEHGAMMCALIPAHNWLYAYFERFGFSSVYLADRQCYTSFHPFTTQAVYHEITDHYAPEVLDAFSRYEMMRPGGVVHSQRDFLNILDDLSFRNGGTFVAVGRDDVTVAGMAWAFDRGDFVQVNELLGIDDDARTGAMQSLRAVFPNRQFTVLAPADDNHLHRRLHSRAMGRIVNVALCLGELARQNPQWKCNIKVHDPLLAVNNNVYRVSNGACGIDNDFSGKLDFDVSIDVFTRIVFSSEHTGSVLGFPSRRTHISLMLH
ncbi:MAG: GNAT family N-acetyltransferase [Firmicutes bacterium]|nr:GNAT family N-acetyltransferase [Bacillota bacterium]MCM1477603.1 GNAT family N-acetyltransferase [Bacteroides sp.]